MRWDLDRIRRTKPDISQIEVLRGRLIGHRPVRQKVADAFADGTPGKSILVVTGPTGSGKSALLDWITTTTRAGAVDLQAVGASIGGFRADGSNAPNALRALQALARESDAEVLVFDDVDSQLLPEGVARLARELFRGVDFRVLVMTARTPMPSAPLPIPVEALTLERRHAEAAEFAGYLSSVLEALAFEGEVFSEEVHESLYALQEESVDFRAVQYVTEMLLSRRAAIPRPISTSDLYHLLTEDPYIHQLRAFPGLQVADGRRLAFRRKDKSELLADTVMRLYESPRELAMVAVEELPGFDRAAFLEEASDSYRDALMSLCLTRPPVEVVEALLGPRDLLREIEALQLDQSKLFDVPEARSHLLVRGLGFTLVEPPRGLGYHIEHVRLARESLMAANLPVDVVKGTGLTVIQHAEAVLLDLLHFWATYLFGSVANLIAAYNSANASRPVRTHRLTSGDAVSLLRYIDTADRDVQRAFALRLVGREQPLSDEIHEAASRFVKDRNSFIHSAGTGLNPKAAQVLADVEGLTQSASNYLARVQRDGAFPAVIKLVEIVFDEYSRRIFRAVDSDGHDIRFALTEQGDEHLVVASHYFMMPARRVCVNPVLVPTSGSSPRVLFEQGDGYDRSSRTQHDQGTRLIDMVTIPDSARVLDVGCGNGVTTVELARRFPACLVDGIDISPEMIKVAQGYLADDLMGRVRFEQADLMQYKPDRPYEVVFSNSSMHWVLPPELAYRQLYESLAHSGRLAVHQGGAGCYQGLWQCAIEVIELMRLGSYFSNWSYPVFYPTRSELADLLTRVGFVDVEVESIETDGKEYPTLYRDFSNAGLLPFAHRLPEIKQEAFRTEFLRHAERTMPDRYTHRLFAFATRP